MNAHTIFKELSKESFWAGYSDKVRWCAARYYAGVEGVDDLQARGRVVCEWQRVPVLTEAEIRMIIQLR